MCTCPQPASSRSWVQKALGRKMEPMGGLGYPPVCSQEHGTIHMMGWLSTWQDSLWTEPTSLRYTSVTGNPTEGQRATNNRDISSQFLKCCWVRVKQSSCLVPQNETGSTRLWANRNLKAARIQGSCDTFLPQCPCFLCSCTISLPFSSNKLVSWSLILWLKQEALGWGWRSPHGFEVASPFQILRTAPLWWINYIWVWEVNAAEWQPSSCGHLRSWGEDGQEQDHNKGWEWWRRKPEQKK